MDQHSPQPADPASGPVVLVGGGGHASVVFETLALLGVQVRGLLDDASEPLLVRRGLSRLGPVSMLGSPDASDSFVLGIGDVAVRRKVLDAFADAGRWISPLHPTATVSPSAAIGRGVWIGPGAIVHTAATINDHAIINTGAIVEHDCKIGENCHLAPACVLGGAVKVGRDTLIGLGSRVLPGVKIGEGCTIGAGAVVVADVPDGQTVAGVPARPLR
ncbi:MAG: acetyltransferase [Phycisphaerales bacterium]|nr:acetyltransferase [Phycisphaerales bacterium]